MYNSKGPTSKNFNAGKSVKAGKVLPFTPKPIKPKSVKLKPTKTK